MSNWYLIFCELPKIGNKPEGITVERHVAHAIHNMSDYDKAKLARSILDTITNQPSKDKPWLDYQSPLEDFIKDLVENE